MSFRVTARTILHLGAELISSDAVALYELVKNAFDAGSPDVEIAVCYRMPIDVLDPLLEEVRALPARSDARKLRPIQERAVAALLPASEGDPPLRAEILAASTPAALEEALAGANSVVVSDEGSGMSLRDLSEIYLTIGTTSRRRELDARRASGAPGETPILGEKGVGRLSAMRLGRRLHVETFRASDDWVNVLDIDWGIFSHDSDALLEEILVEPERGGPKPKGKLHGTVIRIQELSSDWSAAKLEEIARESFSRLNDPFESGSRFPVLLSFNGAAVEVPPFRRLLLEQAHAVMRVRLGAEGADDLLPTGQFRPEASPRLHGEISYRLYGRSRTIDLGGLHLANVAKVDAALLRRVGPFSLELYWYNRQLLRGVDAIGDKRAVQSLVNQWSGGVMVYRDGFRVGRYGGGEDDWLGLDRKALASGGYKVNRAQLIGRLAISALANPHLVDQTNREGLRDSREKQALVDLLKWLIQRQFRAFLNEVEKEVQAREPVDLSDVSDRVLSQRRTVAATLRVLYQRYPAVKSDREIGGRIESAMQTIGDTMRAVESLAESYEKGRAELVTLAGIGLTVAVVAHDLRRATADALATLDALRRQGGSVDVRSALGPLLAQLKTLHTRLRVLDPVVGGARQVKEEVDLGSWVPTIVDAASAGLVRAGVEVEVRASGTFTVKVVPGMVVQVLENLVSNAGYWVARRRAVDGGEYHPKIRVEVDRARRWVRVSDNGPGVEPSMRESIFRPFVSTKPVGEGWGLGLFIAREVAEYSGAELSLAEADDTPRGMVTSFILHFPKARQ